MKIYLGTDHTGLTLKEKIKFFLENQGHTVEDCGAYAYDKEDDYPDFIGKAAKGVSEDTDARGIIIGGSGQGEQMTANKYKNVRCALFYTPAVPTQEIAVNGEKSTDPFAIITLTRQHNHANMLSLAARFLTEEDALKAVEVFLETPVSDDARHVRRINKIKEIENHA